MKRTVLPLQISSSLSFPFFTPSGWSVLHSGVTTVRYQKFPEVAEEVAQSNGSIPSIHTALLNCLYLAILGGADTLFWPLWTSSTHVVHRHVYRQTFIAYIYFPRSSGFYKYGLNVCFYFEILSESRWEKWGWQERSFIPIFPSLALLTISK